MARPKKYALKPGKKRGRKSTNELYEDRVEAVRALVARGDWCRKSAAFIADSFGVTIRQIYIDKATVITRWRDDLTGTDRPAQAAILLEEVRALRRDMTRIGISTQDAKFLSVVERLLTLEADLLGLRSGAAVQIDVRVSPTDPTALAGDILSGLPLIADVLGMAPAQFLEAAFKEGGTDAPD